MPITLFRLKSNLIRKPAIIRPFMRIAAGSPGISFSNTQMLAIGDGYFDGTPQQNVRTSDGYHWVATWKFDHYPQGEDSGMGQTLRMYKGDVPGTPNTYNRIDSANEPLNPTTWVTCVDQDNMIHVLTMIRASWNSGGICNYLKYFKFNTLTGAWGSAEDIETGLNVTEGGQGDELCSMSLDGNGVPHIVYLKNDGTNKRVIYRNRSGGSWSSPFTVDDQAFQNGQHCRHPGLVFDKDGYIVVTWVRGSDEGQSDGRPFIRVWNGSWGTTHDIAGYNMWPGIDSSLRLYPPSSDIYQVSFLNASKQVNFRRSTDKGATWVSNHPGGGTFAGDNPSCGPGPNGTVRIYVHDARSPVGISYWEGSGGDGAWGSIQNYTANGEGPFDCSVNIRWSQYFHYFPNVFDIVYWKALYPTNGAYFGVNT